MAWIVTWIATWSGRRAENGKFGQRNGVKWIYYCIVREHCDLEVSCWEVRTSNYAEMDLVHDRSCLEIMVRRTVAPPPARGPGAPAPGLSGCVSFYASRFMRLGGKAVLRRGLLEVRRVVPALGAVLNLAVRGGFLR